MKISTTALPPTTTSLFVFWWFLFVIVVITILPDNVNSMGTPTSIFGILRNRWIFAGAVNEQQMERFDKKRNGGSGITILHSFPSDDDDGSDASSSAAGCGEGGSNSKIQRKK